jgi:hypothetical protein
MNAEPKFSEDEADDVSDWFTHPQTLALARRALDDQEEMRKELMRVCKASTDPAVTAAYARLEAATVHRAILTLPKKAKK